MSCPVCGNPNFPYRPGCDHSGLQAQSNLHRPRSKRQEGMVATFKESYGPFTGRMSSDLPSLQQLKREEGLLEEADSLLAIRETFRQMGASSGRITHNRPNVTEVDDSGTPLDPRRTKVGDTLQPLVMFDSRELDVADD